MTEYEVCFYRTFSEMLSGAEVNFSNLLFLEDFRGKHTYTDFCLDIRKAAAYFQQIREKNVVLHVSDSYRFAVFYFSAVLTGHLVCLLPENHAVPAALQSSYRIDERLQEMIWKSSSVQRPLAWAALCETDPDAPCTIAFSSGTSSEGKGCVLSQTNLLLDAQHTMRLYRYWEGERLIHILPYWHLFGIVADLIGPIHAGACLYVPATRAHFLKSLSYFQPHSINMPPALADTLCTVIEKTGKTEIAGGSLQKILCAGAPMNTQTALRLKSFGILPCTAYGLTECSPCAAITPDEDVAIGTSGKPIPCVEITIQNGEILISGPTVMLEYYGDAAQTAERIRNGSFYTGDAGYFDLEGNLVVTGRLDSMLVFGNGKKCVPEYVESRLSALPGIEETQLRRAKGSGCDLPELVVVSVRPVDELKATVTPVMKQEGLFPFVLQVQEEKLKRNAMGKLLRKG